MNAQKSFFASKQIQVYKTFQVENVVSSSIIFTEPSLFFAQQVHIF